MPEWMLNLAAFVVIFLLAVVLTISLLGAFDAWRRKCRPQGPDVGLAVFVEDQTPDDVDEDINAPSIATIDLALAHMDRDANPDGINWLLERRLMAMKREAS